MTGPADTSTVEGDELGVGAAAAPSDDARADGPAIGFLGPAGTFSQIAAQRLTAGWGGPLVPVESIVNLIQDLAGGEPVAGGPRLDAVVVPIENSTEGSVGATLDTLVDHAQLVITAELDLPIEQLLVARGPLELGDITQIYSHPQGIAQARRFLAEHVRQAVVVPVSSTSKGIALVATSDEPWAAIGSRRAAELNGCVILRDDIQEQVNVTRFVLIERRGDDVAPQPGSGGSGRQRRASDDGDDRPMKTTVTWQGYGDGSPGWLVRCLSEFAFRGLNLSKIESRPLRGQLGHYRFFADVEGALSTEAVAGAIEGLRNQCDEVRVLGSYPVAADPV